MKKFIIIFLSLVGILISQRNNYIINPSKSLTRGIYKITPIDNDIKQGDIVVFKISKQVKELARERGYILNNVETLMKIVAATKNDKVTISENKLFINKVFWGNISKQDSHFRNLPQKSEKELQPLNDEFLLLSKVDNSFDCRYIGTIKKNDILFKAQLFLKF